MSVCPRFIMKLVINLNDGNANKTANKWLLLLILNKRIKRMIKTDVQPSNVVY